ncbi:restriction endonuclease subunit S [Campylobacter sp. FMV-PI01]|uniref:Restriction endonuclease subunit S n=1 Tax=Campylobacter portucalensis TaxID=2608384 RepID=A0A6L5WJG2_9BACT|nr:restriction endonuclease subunit S [Campylobacter portucalensis]MSN95871.1 restriction endonuclease subunit S [Campylobacter portucalensis]
MNKIENLINKLCPNGVEFKKLGEVCEFKRGKGLKKEDKGTGEIPAILYGELYTTYRNYINNVVTKIDEKLCKSSTLVKENSLLLPISSTTKEAQIGKASVLKVKEIYLGSDAIALTPSNIISSDYLMYLLNSYFFERKKMKNVSGTTIRHLNVSGILEISIPIPPLEIQNEIVKILDAFSELTAELTARKKQYEYYRDKLLSFENLDKWGGYELMSLGEIGEISMCKRILKSETSPCGEVPFYKIGTFGKKADSYISKDKFIEYKSKFSFPNKGDILISTSGTIGRCVVFDGNPAYFQDSNIVWINNNEKIVLNKFLYYYYQLKPWNATTGGTIQRLYNRDLKKVKIPIPPLKTQEKIVNILDKFNTLTSDLTKGLPQEIDLRKKQYEYYREKLLTFKDIK